MEEAGPDLDFAKLAVSQFTTSEIVCHALSSWGRKACWNRAACRVPLEFIRTEDQFRYLSPCRLAMHHMNWYGSPAVAQTSSLRGAVAPLTFAGKQLLARQNQPAAHAAFECQSVRFCEIRHGRLAMS